MGNSYPLTFSNSKIRHGTKKFSTAVDLHSCKFRRFEHARTRRRPRHMPCTMHPGFEAAACHAPCIPVLKQQHAHAAAMPMQHAHAAAMQQPCVPCWLLLAAAALLLAAAAGCWLLLVAAAAAGCCCAAARSSSQQQQQQPASASSSSSSSQHACRFMYAGWAMRFFEFQRVLWPCEIIIWVNIQKTHRRLNLAPRSLMVYLYIDRVLKTCSTCLHLYPLHFDVKYIHIRIHIIFHENFTQKTISTASIYILQGNSTAAATVGTAWWALHASCCWCVRARGVHTVKNAGSI